MSWSTIMEVLLRELGAPDARRIEGLLIEHCAGVRLTVPKRRPLPTPEEIEALAPGRPREAAKSLDVHPTTIYRALRVRRLIR
jgi:hypothetical protein